MYKPAEFLVLEADLRSSGGVVLHLLQTEGQSLLQSVILLRQVYWVWCGRQHGVSTGEGDTNGEILPQFSVSFLT